MKKIFLTIVYILGIFCAFAIGKFIGNTDKREIVCSDDYQVCETACEPNGGLDRVNSRRTLYCRCENGALFDGHDLYKDDK